jgi:hypothetical protein
MTVKTKTNDLIFGFASEDKNETTIRSFLDTDIIKVGGNAIFDYVNTNKTIYAELKSRRIAHNQYPTALIGKNKCDWADENKDKGRTFWFFFAYSDGLYTIQYEKELFDTFRVDMEYQRSYRAGCVDYPSRVVHIPSNKLIPCSV